MSKMPTPENLASIETLWRSADSLTLYGLPYRLRPGQSPFDILERFRHDWIYLGEPGWFYGTTAERRLVEEYLRPLRTAGVVPGNPYEWSYIDDPAPLLSSGVTMRNPNDGKIEVEIRYDNRSLDDSFTITPTSQKIRDAVEEHLARFGEARIGAYYDEYQGEEWIEENLTKSEAKKLRTDGRLRKRVDMYDFGQWRGYDVEHIDPDVAQVEHDRGPRELHVRFRDGSEETFALPRNIGLDDHRAVDSWLRSNDILGVYEWKWVHGDMRDANPASDAHHAAIAARLARGGV